MVENLFGVDYYPEQWDEERWPIDAALMQQAGVNTVRLAEFAWSKLEPEEGVFDFAWLDRAIEIVSQRGIRVILGTPTAAPPAWLIQAYPEILPVNAGGQRASFGMRRHYCPSHPTFHAAVRRIVGAMARHYAAHPAVFAWQIDNEIGSITNGLRCHCSMCRTAFQNWLRQCYGSLEQLNQRWGTIFWSQQYSAWEQIPVPLHNEQTSMGSAHNPSLYLDFTRFTSETWVRYQHLQVEILRELCPRHLLTHNMMGLFPFVDYGELAHDLDIVSLDNYPRLPAVWSQFKGMWSASATAIGHDLMRSLKKQPFWMMEQQAGPSGWGKLSPTPLPGELRLWTWQAIARGAAGIVYFRWRTALIGTEQYWHGVLPHDGTPGRRYREIAQTGQEFQRIGDLATASFPTEVALLRSYDTLWAFEAQPTADGLSYAEQLDHYYNACWRRNIAVDIVNERQSWEDYKLLLAPCLFVLSAEVAARLTDWVKAGGTLVVTFRSGVKDIHNTVAAGPLPGALCELAGVRVTDYTALLAAGTGEPCGGPERLELVFNEAAPQRVSADIWMDELEVQGAQVLGYYRGGIYDGAPAVTLHQVGNGRVIYVGTSLDQAGLDLLIEYSLQQAELAPGITTPANIEIIRRVHEGVDYWFVLNHSTEPQEITLPMSGVDLLSGQAIRQTVRLQGYDVLVIRSQAAEG
jgi:beta-galactosidase